MVESLVTMTIPGMQNTSHSDREMDAISESGWMKGKRSFDEEYVVASYEDLVRVLGAPRGRHDVTKTSTSWDLVYRGHPLWIYDYKATSVYSPGLPSPEDLHRKPKFKWNVAGDQSPEAHEALELIRRAVSDETSRVRKSRRQIAAEVREIAHPIPASRRLPRKKRKSWLGKLFG